jgi:hypothetical protein
MRNLTITLAFIFAMSIATLARSESLEQLKARLQRADTGQRIETCLQIARLQLDNADKLYNDGKIEQARAAITDVVSYTEQAGDSAAKSGKKLKKAEILVRQMANKLRDIKHSLNYDDQAPVQEAAEHLEKVRSSLLAAMFGKTNQ